MASSLIRPWHLGQARTSTTKVRLADWLGTGDRDTDCRLHDRLSGGVIPW